MTASPEEFDMTERELLQVAVARIEEQQKYIVLKLQELSGLLTDTNRRVTVVEEFKWKLIGVSIAVGSMSSIIVMALKNAIMK